MRPAFLFQADIRFLTLALAVLLYGALGSPTPDHPGWREALIGVLLVLSVRLPRAASPRMVFAPLLVLGLSVPLATGLFSGHGTQDMLRDIAPFLFLCLPFFIDPHPHAAMFVRICLIAGVIFAARVLGQGMDILPPATELLYLANSPLVLAAGIIGTGRAAIDVYDGRVRPGSVLYLTGGLICLLAMLVDVQRATILAVIVSLGLLGIIGAIRSPRRMIGPLAVVLVLAFFNAELIAAAWQSMATKTALVGVNMRWQELMAVYDRLQGSWLDVLFGVGWGGRFESPAVEGLSVPYTHSLLSYMALKTGLVGLGATMFALAACLRNIIMHPSLLSLSLFWALLIPVFFYGSYKSLDFGLVLVLAVMMPRAIASRISS